MSQTTKKFFLGANTPHGFVSRFDQLQPKDENWNTYIIKGGPGTGKSTLMKKVASAFSSYTEDIEYIHCSADVNSIDAIIFPELKVSIADGTYPHVLEPKYPGLGENFVVLNDAINSECLMDYKDEIIEKFSHKANCHSQCCKLLSASASLLSDTYSIALPHTNVNKIKTFAKNFCQRELKPILQKEGKEYVRFVSGFTDEGLFVFEETINHFCDDVIFIDDEYGCVCSNLLSEIKEIAIDSGYDVISCYCPLYPFNKIDYLFIPEKRLGLICMNKIHNLSILPHRIIHAQRFCEMTKIKEMNNRIKFNKKAAVQMIERGCSLLADAKVTHSELEEYYIKAMNFEEVERITIDLIQKIKLSLWQF